MPGPNSQLYLIKDRTTISIGELSREQRDLRALQKICNLVTGESITKTRKFIAKKFSDRKNLSLT